MPGTLSSSRFVTHRSLAGGLLLGALAWALLAVQIAQVLGVSGNPLAILFATAIPVMLSATLFVGGLAVYRYELDRWALRISAWTFLGTSLFSAALGIEILILRSRFGGAVPSLVLLANVAAGGAVLGFLVGLYDAHQRLLHRDLRTEYDRTVALSQRLSVLARILRHDIRNELNVVGGQAERIRERTDSGEIAAAATAIQDASDELLEISDHIREFSSILADPRKEERRRSMDLVEVVRTAAEKIRDRYGDETVEIEVTTPDSAVVRASPFLSQAVIELLENAVVHVEGDGVHVDVEISVAEDGIELRIADDGPGIPREELSIHDRGIETQLDHSSGVGLWLVRWVIDDSGGDLSFETRNTGGTTVRVWLPRATR